MSHTDICSTHSLPHTVSPDGWECLRWQFSPATSVVRHHLSAEPVREEKGRNTISPYLTFLRSPRFHSLLFRLRLPIRPALPLFSPHLISLFHTFICYLFAVNFFVCDLLFKSALPHSQSFLIFTPKRSLLCTRDVWWIGNVSKIEKQLRISEQLENERKGLSEGWMWYLAV